MTTTVEGEGAMAAQQAWWDSMTDAQKEAYEDRLERERAERQVYGHVLTDAEREKILA